MDRQRHIAAVVWAPEENRTELIAGHLGAELHTVHYLYYKRPLFAPVKYVPQTIKTLWILFRRKPRVVYVTNPPVFAALTVAAYCRLTGAEFVMDTHSPALYSKRWGWSVPLQRFASRRALVNVLDQQRYVELFESWGSRALVLEKPIAEGVFSDNGHHSARPREAPFTVTVINTFAVDEPLEPILEAAERLPDVRFVVLGDTSLADQKLLERAPRNVEFPGYLLKEAYWRQLERSNAVMALTTYPYSLLAGGHDGLALEKPLILSDQPALTDFYDRGVIFVDNSSESIAEAVLAIREDEPRYIAEVRAVAQEKRRQWQANFDRLAALIDEASA